MAWSLSAKDILLQGVSGSVVTFSVTLDGKAATTFDLIPIDGEITISFRWLLEAILPAETGLDPMLSRMAVKSGAHNVSISAIDDLNNIASMSLTCIRGGIDESAGNGKITRWLSWKPQVSQTFRWGRELLSLLVMPGNSGAPVEATIYYRYHSPETITLAEVPPIMDAKPCIWNYDCSYATIAAMGTYSEEDTIVAYDITMGDLPRRRFVLGPTDKRGREFIFRNSMGVLDTLFTSGELSAESESETATAKVNNKETEIVNNFISRLKVTTGLLQKERDIANLYDFLRSNERYALTPGGTAKRIVVDGAESNIAFGQPSGATITFHLADGFTGGYYEDKNLGEYEFTTAE